MPKEYQEFSISNYRTGFNESVEPWLLPRDAFQLLVNAHLYRGVIEKILGYQLFASFSYRNAIALDRISSKVYTKTLTSIPITTNFYGYGEFTGGAEIFSYSSDASATVINLTGNQGGTGTVNLSTLLVTLNFKNTVSDTTDVFFYWDSAPSAVNAIMGIKQYFRSDNSQDVMVFDQVRVGLIISIFGVIASTAGTLQGISEIPHDYYQSAVFTSSGGAGPYTGTLQAKFIVPGTLHFIEYSAAGVLVNNNIFDDGVGNITGTNVSAGTINYVTGAYSITFTAPPTTGDVFDSTAGVFGNLFTGSISNFFSLTNYQYKAFFTNNVDLIMYYDGTTIKFLNTNTTPSLLITASGGFPTSFPITRTLHVFTNRERLLLIEPTILAIPQPGVQWSVVGNPLDFTNNEFLLASTSERIVAIGYINSDLIIRFTNSERAFRYTSDAFSPFRFDSTNNIWACDAPYSSINYDTYFTTVGRPAIVGSDGINVRRVDEAIPDFTDPTILSQETPVPFLSQTSIIQCYGERFDDIKEGWLCYNSGDAETVATASTNVLAFNYLDESYAIYDFPFSCLGYGRIQNVPTWGTTFTTWKNAADNWGDYNLQSNALTDLAGDQFDTVFELNEGNAMGDGITPVLMNCITKNFNPFIESGQLARFGYLDLYVSAYNQTIVRVQFFINDELWVDENNQTQGWYQETILTFNDTDAMSPTQSQTKVWKRIYIGSVGKIHQIRIYQNALDFTADTLAQPIFIHSMVLYMKPAGRIFN